MPMRPICFQFISSHIGHITQLKLQFCQFIVPQFVPSTVATCPCLFCLISAQHSTPLAITFSYQSSTLGSPFMALLWTGFVHICQAVLSPLFMVSIKPTIILSIVAYLRGQCWDHWSSLRKVTPSNSSPYTLTHKLMTHSYRPVPLPMTSQVKCPSASAHELGTCTYSEQLQAQAVNTQ